MKFELADFIDSCRAERRNGHRQKAIRELVTRTVREKNSVIDALGEPNEASLQTIHHAHDLTILNVVWAPQMSVMPHDHHMPAVIGVYAGGEDNIFWRRDGETIEAVGAQAIREGEAVSLGPDVIHSVNNPLQRFSGAIHVYSGDFFAAQRSEWDPYSLNETPYDAEKTVRLFHEANARHYGRQSLPN